MKESRLNLRISTRRLNKLRLYAASKEKTITSIVEDWIDRLPNTEIGEQRGLGGFRQEATANPKGNSSSTSLPH